MAVTWWSPRTPVTSRRLSGHRVLVGAWPVNRGEERTHLPQIHRELAAVVVPVIEEDRPEHRGPRHRHELSCPIHHGPRRQQRRVVHPAENSPRVLHALVELGEKLPYAFRAGPGDLG